MNKHDIDINDISQDDKLEVKISPENDETYILKIEYDPTYDIKNKLRIFIWVLDTSSTNAVPNWNQNVDNLPLKMIDIQGLDLL